MEAIISDIVNNLKKLDTKYIILFGSYASETYTDDSDIDLIVILDSNEIPDTYEKRMANKLMVRNCIYELSRKKAIDLVVYTEAEYDLIKHSQTSFYNEISETGKILYEKAS